MQHRHLSTSCLTSVCHCATLDSCHLDQCNASLSNFNCNNFISFASTGSAFLSTHMSQLNNSNQCLSPNSIHYSNCSSIIDCGLYQDGSNSSFDTEASQVNNVNANIGFCHSASTSCDFSGSTGYNFDSSYILTGANVSATDYMSVLCDQPHNFSLEFGHFSFDEIQNDSNISAIDSFLYGDLDMVKGEYSYSLSPIYNSPTSCSNVTDMHVTEFQNSDLSISQLDNRVSHNNISLASFVSVDKSFGMIRLGKEVSVLTTSTHTISGNGLEWLIEARRVINKTGLPNYMKARIPVKSSFNIERWKFWLNGSDNRLIDYLTFGFPLSISEQAVCNNSVDNHASSKKFPDQVIEFFQAEINHNAMLGPFDTRPLEPLHVSPLMSRDKPNGKKRIIVDLSYPPGQSVNDKVTEDYDGVPFKLSYPSIDSIARRIVSLGDKAMLFKIDLSRAFRNMRIDPRDVHHLGLCFQDKYYLDISTPFGYKFGSANQQRISDAIRGICARNGFWLFCYIDDYIGIETIDSIFRAFKFLTDLLADLGLSINHDKTVPPCKALTAIGIRVDASLYTLSIDPDKLKEIFQVCTRFMSYTHITKQKLQSLIGKLIYVSKCVSSARLFVCRLLGLLRSIQKGHKVKLTVDFYRDLNWFISARHMFTGKVFIKSNRELQIVYVDACLEGLGAYYSGEVYAVQTPTQFQNLGIVQLEMLNVFIALKLWGSKWSGKRVRLYCDNMAVVQVLTKLATKDDFLQVCARNVWQLTMKHDIELKLLHVRGKDNVYADILSRWFTASQFDRKYTDFLSYKCQWNDILPFHFSLDYSL